MKPIHMERDSTPLQVHGVETLPTPGIMPLKTVTNRGGVSSLTQGEREILEASVKRNEKLLESMSH